MKKYTKEDIRNLKSLIVSTLKKHKIKKAGIFGSYATGKQKKKQRHRYYS